MKTQTFKAKDVKSAINLVNDEFGEKAIILSTKKNNGFVEIEASDNENIIKNHEKLKEEKNTFSKTFLKHLEGKNSEKNVENNISYLNKKTFNKISDDNSKKLFEKINDNIDSMRKEISNMIITDQSGISDELSYFTPIKLRQEKFSPEIINKLNYSFIGKKTEEGRVSFFRELSKKLASNDFSRLLKSKNIFVFGNSGSGKSTLSAKIASYLSDAKLTKKINFIDVSSSSTGHSDVLRSYSRVLGFSIQDYKNFNFNDKTSTYASGNGSHFDIGGYFNTGTYRYLPLVAGYYSFSMGVLLEHASYLFAIIRKNGTAEFTNRAYTAGGIFSTGQVNGILYLDGVDDYVDCTVYHNQGGSQNIRGADADRSATYFCGHLIG